MSSYFLSHFQELVWGYLNSVWHIVCLGHEKGLLRFLSNCLHATGWVFQLIEMLSFSVYHLRKLIWIWSVAWHRNSCLACNIYAFPFSGPMSPSWKEQGLFVLKVRYTEIMRSWVIQNMPGNGKGVIGWNIPMMGLSYNSPIAPFLRYLEDVFISVLLWAIEAMLPIHPNWRFLQLRLDAVVTGGDVEDWWRRHVATFASEIQSFTG